MLPLIALVTGPPVVEWAAPVGCPGGDDVIAEARRLGADLDETSFAMRGELALVEGGYTLALSVETESGATHRELRAQSCESLAHAAALVLAVALDPFRIPAPPIDATAPPPPPTPLPDATFESAAPVDRTPPDRTPSPKIRGAVIVSGLAGRGISPGVDGRAQLGLGLDVAWLRAELLGFHAFARPERYDDRRDVGAQIGGWGTSLRAGPRFTARPIELACPLGLTLAAVVGSGFGADQNWERAELQWGVVLAPAVRVLLGERFAIGADAELEVAIRRPAFAVDDLGAVYRTPRLGARGGIRLEVRFFGKPRDQTRRTRRRR